MNDGRHPSNLDGRNLDRLDDDLRDRFAGLRQQETQRVPEFASMWHTRAPLRKGRWLVAVACALIVVAAIIWLRSTQRRPEEISVAAITAWNSPTDFLLETPGREILRTVPKIGDWPGYLPPAAPAVRPSRGRKKFL
jgi:hypothetical protein